MNKKKVGIAIGFVVAVLAIIAVVVMLPKANVEVGDYEVILPESYESSKTNYPVVYVLPQNGYEKDDSGITEKLQEAMKSGYGAEMIIVQPVFERDTDVRAVMEALAEKIDEEYCTAADRKYRALVGTGVGGYLAYAVGLESDDVFSAIASIRGDFVSEENPWCESYGEVSQLLQNKHNRDSAVFDGFYTYMDAPVDDAWTTMEGSTNDLGAKFINYGTASAFHEFTVRPGSYTEEFLTESVNRVADRFTNYMLSGVAEGTVALENATLSEQEKTAKASYSLNITEAMTALVSDEIEAEVVISMVDPVTNEVLAQTSEKQTITGETSYTGEMEVDNVVNGSSANVKLSIKLFGAEIELASTSLTRSQGVIIKDDYQKLDLSGNWYFNYTGRTKKLDVTTLEAKEYETWSVVQPGLESWKKGFGNINDENVKSTYGDDYFDYMILGNAYYVKEFEVPEAFDSQELELSIGYVDDRCEVYLNGERVGATGMDEWGNPTGDTTWAQYSKFEIDASILNRGGMNTVVVRAYNDGPYGAGGWYGGPIGLYSKSVFKNPGGPDSQSEEEESRFTEKTFKSEYAAEALGERAPVENKYLLYLPKDYEETDRYYPTVYLLHQFNSDHTSYKTDKIDQLLDKAMEEGIFDEMIVVVPNSSEESWWTGSWKKMITEELIPLIDSEYRTIRDARYRLTAGCSMGGQGAFGVALTNPDYFSGAVSFFGALSMPPTDKENAFTIANKESVDYLKYYALYFICGNQDSYGFGVPAVDLNQILTEKGVEHGFFIENGGHDSGFYVPFFDDVFSYVRSNMYQSDEGVESILKGSLNVSGTKATAEINVLEAIGQYLNVIPESSYTQNTNPDLIVPVTIQVVKDGNVVCKKTEYQSMNSETGKVTFEYDFGKDLNGANGYSVELKAAIFDRVVTLDQQ